MNYCDYCVCCLETVFIDSASFFNKFVNKQSKVLDKQKAYLLRKWMIINNLSKKVQNIAYTNLLKIGQCNCVAWVLFDFFPIFAELILWEFLDGHTAWRNGEKKETKRVRTCVCVCVTERLCVWLCVWQRDCVCMSVCLCLYLCVSAWVCECVCVRSSDLGQKKWLFSCQC